MGDATVAASEVRLARWGKWLGLLLRLLAFVILALVLAPWLMARVGALAGQAHLGADAIQAPLRGWQLWLGALVALVPAACRFAGYWSAGGAFARMGQGRAFSADVVRGLRRFALFMVAALVLDVVSSAGLSVILTAGNPPGQHMLSMGLGAQGGELLSIAFAWVMALALEFGAIRTPPPPG